jgi:zinicin-like metallopeptidase
VSPRKATTLRADDLAGGMRTQSTSNPASHRVGWNESRSGPLLGLYQGVPLTRRGSSYSAVLPDKITLFRGPLGDSMDGARRRFAGR